MPLLLEPAGLNAIVAVVLRGTQPGVRDDEPVLNRRGFFRSIFLKVLQVRPHYHSLINIAHDRYVASATGMFRAGVAGRCSIGWSSVDACCCSEPAIRSVPSQDARKRAQACASRQIATPVPMDIQAASCIDTVCDGAACMRPWCLTHSHALLTAC
jgi:hypothetical protein